MRGPFVSSSESGITSGDGSLRGVFTLLLDFGGADADTERGAALERVNRPVLCCLDDEA